MARNGRRSQIAMGTLAARRSQTGRRRISMTRADAIRARPRSNRAIKAIRSATSTAAILSGDAGDDQSPHARLDCGLLPAVGAVLRLESAPDDLLGRQRRSATAAR